MLRISKLALRGSEAPSRHSYGERIFRRYYARAPLGGLTGGHSDFSRDVLTIRSHGVDITLKVNEMGHYVLSVVVFGEGP